MKRAARTGTLRDGMMGIAGAGGGRDSGRASSGGPILAGEPVLAALRRHAALPGEALLGDTGAIGRVELAERVAAAAAALRAAGLGPGTAVGLTIVDPAEHLVACLALIASGAAQICLPSFEPPGLRASLAARVGVEAVLADDGAEAPPGLRLLRWRDLRAAVTCLAGPPPPDPDAPAIFLSSSGISGRPKLVALSLRQVGLQAVRGFSRHEGARMACFASPEHNIAKRLGLYTLLLGGTALLSAARGEALNAFLRAARADWLYGSLQHAADLVALGRRGHPLPPGVTLRMGGLRVPLALRHEVLAHVTPDFRVSYGATEIGSIASAGPGQHDEEGSVGLVVPGVEVGILRADGTEAAPGEPGAIRIRAPGMATAYHDDPEQTAERFRGGWFHPGDMVSRRADGTLVVHGRADDMMILNGINIFPPEIEAMLESHPAVAHAAALPVPSAAHGEIPVAAVELRPGARASAAELLAFARARLGLRAPRRVLVLDALPRNPQGKVIRRELATRFAPAGSA